MESDAPITLQELEKMVKEAVDKFFHTMLDLQPQLLESLAATVAGDDMAPPIAPIETKSPLVVGMVGFIGNVSGIMYLYLEEEFANKVACAFLGMELDEIIEEGEDTVNDVMGEMSNMIVGTFKNQLMDQGLNARMTIPSIVRGNSFYIETPATVMRRIYRFTAQDHTFAIDVTLKPGDPDS